MSNPPLWTPCFHKGVDLAGGVCAACWEERASAVNFSYRELQKQLEKVSVCKRHLAEISKPGCIMCRGEDDREAVSYFSRIILQTNLALTKNVEDPDYDKVFETVLADLEKAASFVEARRKRLLAKRTT